jgi:transcriptional regulator with XRE-family HTH domain
MEYLSKIILYHRKRAGLSREACATLAGVGKTAIYDVEHGKPSIRLDTLLKILHVLNIKLDFQSPLMQEFQALNSLNTEPLES